MVITRPLCGGLFIRARLGCNRLIQTVVFEDILKVLIIDDSKTIRRTAEALLVKEGHEVMTAGDGFAALAKVTAFKPDLIFVDIMMPRLDGYQTCALIRDNASYANLHIVLLSSKDGLFDRARGRLVGAACYMTKPFSSEAMVDVIASLTSSPA